MIIGMIIIAANLSQGYLHWISSKTKFSYARPHVSRFVRKVHMLPLFAIRVDYSFKCLHAMLFQYLMQVIRCRIEAGVINSKWSFLVRYLDTFNILIIGLLQFLHLIPIVLTKREKSGIEKEDYDKWFDNTRIFR